MRIGTWVRLRAGTAAAVALALTAAACTATGTGPLAGLTGAVSADGSSTVFPIAQAIAEEFGREAGKVKVTVGVAGTGGGFKKFCNGETDLSNASRPIKASEKQACARNGVEYLELTVAVDGLSVVVHKKNTFVQCLTVEELKKIWSPGSRVKNWSQIRAGFPSRRLKLYGPGTDSGTFDYFTEVVNGKAQASRSDFTANEDDNYLVTGIAGDEGALGYFGFAYYEENTDKLNVVAVDGGDGCVTPSRETINNGTYKPLSRPLFIYIAKTSVAKPQVAAFVDFLLANVSELVPDVGFIALPDAQLAAEKAEWEAAKGA